MARTAKFLSVEADKQIHLDLGGGRGLGLDSLLHSWLLGLGGTLLCSLAELVGCLDLKCDNSVTSANLLLDGSSVGHGILSKCNIGH